MNCGPAQSVYQLNTARLTRSCRSRPRPLAPGAVDQAARTAPGTLTFTGYRQWISLAITYDPGQLPALIVGAWRRWPGCCCPSSSGGAGCSSGPRPA